MTPPCAQGSIEDVPDGLERRKELLAHNSPGPRRGLRLTDSDRRGPHDARPAGAGEGGGARVVRALHRRLGEALRSCSLKCAVLVAQRREESAIWGLFETLSEMLLYIKWRHDPVTIHERREGEGEGGGRGEEGPGAAGAFCSKILYGFSGNASRRLHDGLYDVGLMHGVS